MNDPTLAGDDTVQEFIPDAQGLCIICQRTRERCPHSTAACLTVGLIEAMRRG